MNKSSNPSSLKNMNFDEDWSSHPAVEWLSNHKRTLLWALFALIAVLMIILQIMTWKTESAEKDFFQAQAAFNQFQQTASAKDSNASNDLQQLETIMQRHPELKPKYEGALAQTLLIEGQIPQSKVFVDDIFNRTQTDHLQLYQNYTQTSLLIGQENYNDALQHSEQLKVSLDKDKVNPILYVFNLIRLAMLYQQTDQPEQELKAWEELQHQTQRKDAVLVASEMLKIGNASLSQYIEERKHALMH